MLGVSFRVRFSVRFRSGPVLVSGSGLRLGLELGSGSHSVSGLVLGSVLGFWSCLGQGQGEV